ncbi:MAG: YraN family protein [Arenicellales bacterium]
MSATRSTTASFPRNSVERGKEVEDFALRYLEREKFRLLERNFHCKGGELDLIMTDRDELVFVEVRYRGSVDFGDGIESVDRHKQRKLRIAAETWLQRNPQITFRGCRFDVISVSGKSPNYQIEWVDDAF